MSNFKRWRDLAVRTGSYTDANGETKSRFENVGVVLRDGNDLMILLRPTFNPAGVPREEGRDMVTLSVFAPKEHTNGATRGATTASAARAADAAGAAGDDVPFN